MRRPDRARRSRVRGRRNGRRAWRGRVWRRRSDEGAAWRVPVKKKRVRPASAYCLSLLSNRAFVRGNYNLARREIIVGMNESRDLFGAGGQANVPLAERLRPRTIDEMVGQRHLLGEGKPIRVAL